MKLVRRRIEREANEGSQALAATLPIVRRVHTDHGSHIEPPCEDDWPAAMKIAWQAAVVAHDTGLNIRVWVTDDGRYQFQVGNSSMSAMRFHDAWRYLNGVSMGAEAYRGLTD